MRKKKNRIIRAKPNEYPYFSHPSTQRTRPCVQGSDFHCRKPLEGKAQIKVDTGRDERSFKRMRTLIERGARKPWSWILMALAETAET